MARHSGNPGVTLPSTRSARRTTSRTSEGIGASALSAEDLQKEARFHMDAEAADNVPDALRKAIDYADENNLAGVVVCGSLYLAAEARPWLLKEAEK